MVDFKYKLLPGIKLLTVEQFYSKNHQTKSIKSAKQQKGGGFMKLFSSVL